MEARDKDWTTPAARRELAALHAAMPQGVWTAHRVTDPPFIWLPNNGEVETDTPELAVGIAAAVNALPALLARIERDEALLARAAAELPCSDFAAGGAVCGSGHLCRTCALLADLRAAGFAPEEE